MHIRDFTIFNLVGGAFFVAEYYFDRKKSEAAHRTEKRGREEVF